MKKPPDFTLVRKFDLGDQEPLNGKVRSGDLPNTSVFGQAVDGANMRNYAQAEQAVLDSLKSTPGLVDTYANQAPQFKKALVDSFVRTPTKAAKPLTAIKPEVSPSLISVVSDLSRSDRVYRVGLLDMGAWIGGLPKLLERLNEAQPLFTIFEVQAPIPGGLLKTSVGMADWVDEGSDRRINDGEREKFEPHVIFDEFFAAAESIRKDLLLDQIVGLTPAMVAFTQPDGTKHWNHFSAVHSNTALLSTFDLRQFAEAANRPYEAAVGALLVASLLVDINSGLHYHDDTGCLFDYNENRVSMVTTLKHLSIDEQCLREMTPEQSEAARRMLGVLRRMKRRSS